MLKSLKETKMYNNILNWFEGNFRYFIYSKISPRLLKVHIREQIESRLLSMDTECFNDGSCKFCGCTTPALRFCDKSCDKPCYPPLIGKILWNRLKESPNNRIFIDHIDNQDNKKLLRWNLDLSGRFKSTKVGKNGLEAGRN